MDDRTLEEALRAYYRKDEEPLARRVAAPDCPGLAVLRRAALGESLPPAAETHLAVCPSCRRNLALFRQEGSTLRHRRSVRRAWAVAAATCAVLLLLVSAVRLGPPVTGDGAWRRLASASLAPDLRRAREEFQQEYPSMLPRLRRGPEGPGAGTAEKTGGHPSSGTAFLPGDSIEFRAADPEGRGPYTLVLNGVPHTGGLKEPRIRLPAPPGGWPEGPHGWAIRAAGGRRIAQGRFLIPGEEVRRLVARAEREFRNDPARLAAVYGLLGLETRFGSLFERLTPEERERLQVRFGIGGRSRTRSR